MSICRSCGSLYRNWSTPFNNKRLHSHEHTAAATIGKLLSKIFGNKEMRILMLGLDAAGKTSIFLDSRPTMCYHDINGHMQIALEVLYFFNILHHHNNYIIFVIEWCE